jgi:hypothetical protein
MIDDMDSFEEKIRDCSENLASIELPEGHKARFRRRLLNSRKAAHRAVLLRWSSSAVAACLVIALSVLGAITYQQSGEPAQADNSQMVTPGYGIYVDYMRKIENMTGQIADMGATMSESDYYMVNAAIDNITSENVPLEEQLPEEMDSNEREQVLQNYYDCKAHAVQRLVNYAKDANKDN